ncbi:hypothetical protein SAMN05421827_12356 [Pedobacter terrae]|uniref:Uncharacterized protein n=1 Tax=Pedobacter terrae TaxID=405671 RepID=A0A1G8C3I7_9SPHI|nr:hypothetical protein SAMN05421827_12356 [Pedobacter terrae]
MRLYFKLYIQNQIRHVELVEMLLKHLKKSFDKLSLTEPTSLVVILAYAGILKRLH